MQFRNRAEIFEYLKSHWWDDIQQQWKNFNEHCKRPFCQPGDKTIVNLLAKSSFYMFHYYCSFVKVWIYQVYLQKMRGLQVFKFKINFESNFVSIVTITVNRLAELLTLLRNRQLALAQDYKIQSAN